MLIRYPGPAVTGRRRGQPEYISRFGLPLKPDEVIEVEQEVGETLCAGGIVECMDPPAAIAAPAPEVAGPIPAPPEETRPARRASKGGI
jgi:hypothetical protein